jgi:hypothetical protein
MRRKASTSLSDQRRRTASFPHRQAKVQPDWRQVPNFSLAPPGGLYARIRAPVGSRPTSGCIRREQRGYGRQVRPRRGIGSSNSRCQPLSATPRFHAVSISNSVVPGDCPCLTRSPVQPASVALSAMIIRIRICCLPDQDDLYNRNSWWRASLDGRPNYQVFAFLLHRVFHARLNGNAWPRRSCQLGTMFHSATSIAQPVAKLFVRRGR